MSDAARAAVECDCGEDPHWQTCAVEIDRKARHKRNRRRIDDGPPIALMPLLHGYVERHARRCAPPSLLGRLQESTGRMPSDVGNLSHGLAARLIGKAEARHRKRYPMKPLPLEELLTARLLGRGRVSGFSWEQLAELAEGAWTAGELERAYEAALQWMRRALRDAEEEA